jgi:hypothetical protein
VRLVLSLWELRERCVGWVGWDWRGGFVVWDWRGGFVVWDWKERWVCCGVSWVVERYGLVVWDWRGRFCVERGGLVME